MALASTPGRGRLVGFAVAASLRAMAYRLSAGVSYRLRFLGRMPERLLIAPTDLRTADPTMADEIYSGRFSLGGEVVDVGRRSIFTMPPPSENWASLLHGFGWLRHLRASDMTVARPHARLLISDWIALQGRHGPVARQPEVTARRVISWLSQTPMILDGCDHAFYRRFMRSLVGQVRHLRVSATNAPAGMPRLQITIALAAAALSMAGHERMARQSARWLDAELSRQILPDGGHISRSPAATLELLADLLPLRQTFTARGMQPSRTLVAAIDRMMPMLRFFRHGDGSLARFNGTGDTPFDLIATVLAYDDARGQPVPNAPHSGYQRMTAGHTTVLVDTGPPPPIAVSGEAHAGCLSFEMSVGRQPMIVNCGRPRPIDRKHRRVSRTTAAHSTATINDSSSCRFLTRPGLSARLGEVILAGPGHVPVERGQEDGSIVVRASHDGYVERFGMVHERRLKLSATGDRLEGTDTFLTEYGQPVGRRGRDSFAIRFHLHPTVTARRAESGRGIELELADGEIWIFESSPEPGIEESVMFSDVHGTRRTEQVVITGRPQQQPSVSWRLRRVAFRPGMRLPEGSMRP
jgi:uncharacterized heparinase superfamily protein